MENNDKLRTAIPNLLLEQWRLGELSKDRKEKLIEEFGQDHIQRELAALDAEEEKFLQNLPPLSLSSATSEEKKTNVVPLRRSPLRYLTPLLIAAVALLMIYLPKEKNSPNPFPTDEILLKGGPQPLTIYKQGADGPLSVQDGDSVKTGDVIQLVYSADNYDYGIIISVDGQGHFTWHWPEDPSLPAELVKDRPVPLKNSFRLDESPGFERFFFLRSKNPIANLDLEKAAAGVDFSQEARLKLDSQIDQFSMLLRK